MSNYSAVVGLSKWLTGATMVILGVGIFFIPSDEQKLRKFKEREIKFEQMYNKTNKQQQADDLTTLQRALLGEKRDEIRNSLKVARKQEENQKKESINVFKDL